VPDSAVVRTTRSPSPSDRARAIWLNSVWCWFDSSNLPDSPAASGIAWVRVLPFIALHAACISVAWVGVSPFALVATGVLYMVRMFAVTAFYHRYFSHRTFRTSRALQFVFAVIAATSVQRGPLWWAAHHRNHHLHADAVGDPHSPALRGFFWSHMGWFLTPGGFQTDWRRIPDLMRYPELRWLDRFDIFAPVLLAAGLYALGTWLSGHAPRLGTSGPQLLVWGFCISTVVLFHATVTINSLAHRFGTRRFATRDASRNNFWLALLTFGEGWHNNHHFYPGSARQGFRWWEIDITYYGLKLMELCGLVHNLRPVPARVLSQRSRSRCESP
jgi:stearoyl-CoA desaturase (delta-9 desaturase)